MLPRLPRWAAIEPVVLRGAQATWPASLFLGWLGAGLTNLALELLSDASTTVARRAVVGSFAVDLGRHIAFGLVSATAVWGWRRYASAAPRLGWLAFFAFSCAFGALILPTDLAGLAERSAEDWQLPESVVIGGIVLAIGGGVPVVAALVTPRSWGLGSWRNALSLGGRLLALTIAGLAVWLNLNTSPGGNPSAHFYLSWITAIAVAAVLPRIELGGRAFWSARSAWALGAVLVSWGLWAVFGLHSNGVLIQIARRPSALQLAALFQSDGGLDGVEATLAAHAGPFFSRRDAAPSTPPSARRELAAAPIVIFFSVDSLRADIPHDARHSKFVPQLVELMNQRTRFRQARAPGSMTKYTLASISSGRYFSQQDWGKAGELHWPFADKSRHLASVLGENGVFTAAFPAANWLENGPGVLRGFEHNTWTGDTAGRKQHWVGGEHLTVELIEKLEQERSRPGFYWVHYLDSHDPFTKGGSRGKKFDRYLRALGVVDGYLGELRAGVTRLGLEQRVLWVLMSDHGEAFGEHGSFFHGSTMYDELLRVPLVIAGPGVVARDVDAPVSLIDLGPTVLDWFGLHTPASFMGESLVPFMLGQSREFSRPIVAETRLKQAMLFDDQHKVIRDLRRGTLELYDLARDPGELENLSDDVDPDQEEHVLLMRSFFQVHTYRENGYRVPYVK